MQGRPKKYPDLSVEAEREQLIQKACALFAVPFDDRRKRDPEAPTIYGVAAEMGISRVKVRKLLISGGYYSSGMSRDIEEAWRAGMTKAQICTEFDLSPQTVDAYTSYRKGAYILDEPGCNAERCRKLRARRKALSDLHTYLSGNADETAKLLLWKAVIAFEGYGFQTIRSGTRFRYTVSGPGGSGGRHYKGPTVPGYGNEITIKGDTVEKRISRSTIDLAFQNAMEKEIKGPKALGVPGAGSYLYSMFLRFKLLYPDQQHWLEDNNKTRRR